MTDKLFEEAFNYWFKECEKLVRARSPYYSLSYKWGRKWLIVSLSMSGQVSNWAILNKAGDIFLPATQKGATPAEHVRGNIFGPDRGMKGMTWIGPEHR